MTACVLRPAGPDEIDLLVDIDDDACALLREAGLDIVLPVDHPFLVDERARWLASARAGTAWLALADGEPAGFAAIGTADGAPYLDQLSVRRTTMRRGLGTRLLRHALAESAAAGALWLTTYAHVPWNRPFYERHGFLVVDEAECGPVVRAHLGAQRAVLPAPGERVAMVHRHAPRQADRPPVGPSREP